MLIVGVLLTAIGIFVYLRKTNKRIQDIRLPSRNWPHAVDVIHLTRTKKTHVVTHSLIHFFVLIFVIFKKIFCNTRAKCCLSLLRDFCAVWICMNCVYVVYICTKYFSYLMVQYMYYKDKNVFISADLCRYNFFVNIIMFKKTCEKRVNKLSTEEFMLPLRR